MVTPLKAIEWTGAAGHAESVHFIGLVIHFVALQDMRQLFIQTCELCANLIRHQKMEHVARDICMLGVQYPQPQVSRVVLVLLRRTKFTCSTLKQRYNATI